MNNFNNIQNFSFVSPEHLESYGNRLRWNLAFNIPINGLAAFLILKFSTPAMGIYKYFILATIFSAFFMDFHSSFIYGFYNFVPLAMSCPTGITRKWGWLWGTATIHFTMSCCGLSLAYSIIYQYFSLTKDAEIFKKPKIIAAIFLSVLLFPLPSIILFILTLDYENGRKFVFENYPEISKIFDDWSCSMQMLSPITYAYLGVAALQVLTLFVFVVIIGIKLSLKLEELKHSLSIATLKAHKQYILALYIQGTVPFMLIVIPLIFIIFTVVFNVTNSQDLFQFAFQCFGLHSCGNAITVMYIIKPYRKALNQWFQNIVKIFYIKKEYTVNVFPLNSVASVNTMISKVI